MPEGDTIFRAARTLNLALAGSIVTRFASVYPALTRVDEDAPIAGRVVTGVEARGKHLLMHFGPAPAGLMSAGLETRATAVTLRTHMRMSGSWHVYRPGEPWQLPRRDARIELETPRFVAVAFNVVVAEFLDAARLDRQEDLRRLGPDLLGAEFDEAEAIARLRARGDEPVADAILNQRAVAGIGNVYKSETLFLEKIHPLTPIAALTDDALAALLRTARRLLRANVTDGSPAIVTYRGLRRTTGRDDPGARLWVYGRGGKPCRECGTAITFGRLGTNARGTWWCDTCQRAPSK